MLDVAVTHGPDCIVYDHGTTNIDFGTGTGAEMRFFHLLGATVMDSWAGVGDLPMGCIQTWGNFNADGTSDDWFNADYIADLDRQPGVHAHPRRPLHVGSALPRRHRGVDRARLQRQLRSTPICG